MISDNLGGVNHSRQPAVKALGFICQPHEELKVFVANKPEHATLRTERTHFVVTH